MATPIWLVKGDIAINQDNLCALGYQQDPNNGLWYIIYSFNGVDWVRNTVDSFPTQAAVRTALSNYVTSLG